MASQNMTEEEFNEQRDQLVENIKRTKTFEDKLCEYDKFVNFMQTKSRNAYWNPEERNKRVILLPNGKKIPFH